MDKLSKLNKILESPTHEEVAEIFKAIIKHFKDTVSAMEQRVANGERGMTDKQRELMKKGEEVLEKWQYLSSLEDKGKGMEMGYAGLTKKIEGQMAKIQALSDRLKSIKASDLSLEAADITEKRVKRFIPKIEDIESIVRDSIRTIIEERDKESKSAIEGFKNEIKKLEKTISSKTSGGVRRVYQPYVDDFTSLTDGSTKIFYLSREPLRTNTIQIFGTDFPTILRPTTDFTIVGKKLTLTSAVPAPNTGATLLAHYFA